MAPTVSPSSTGWPMVRARVTVVKSSRRTLIEIVRPRALLAAQGLAQPVGQALQHALHLRRGRRCRCRTCARWSARRSRVARSAWSSRRSAARRDQVVAVAGAEAGAQGLGVGLAQPPQRGDAERAQALGGLGADAGDEARRAPAAKRSHACSLLIATRPRGFSASQHDLGHELVGADADRDAEAGRSRIDVGCSAAHGRLRRDEAGEVEVGLVEARPARRRATASRTSVHHRAPTCRGRRGSRAG